VPFHSGLLPPRSHSRADSGPWEPSAMASISSASIVKQVHTSPSKVSVSDTHYPSVAHYHNSQRQAELTMQDSYRVKCTA
jgi:hypothetical protein